ncbi:MAG TPA: anti-sigma factor RsbA family regulatory protein [Baekduia sp.]|uniref:anti-sigma factor RsbA family regulatory protein n=1 Tax=Baekduia sp. TaxID=2600305 RepID=UPI002C09CC3F|nr:anti-sigma factor RsbA family regulatory protein [Baekduia sp.]HMJ35140.1 anti-sigma factor RsbA family regulatory protein [Baekduia sp.]
MSALVHEALMYEGLDEFLEGTSAFVNEGLAAGETVVVAVPEPRLTALRDRLDGPTEHLGFMDMAELGRNPARIIPTLRNVLDANPGRRLRWVGEPVWPGRRPCENVEGERHEALLNVAFADVPVSILCPYDVGGLDPTVLVGAQRTHPVLHASGRRWDSVLYGDPSTVAQAAAHPLDPVPPTADERRVDHDLYGLRLFVRDRASAAGLDGARLDDLLLAANEAAANTLLHGGGRGVLRIWRDDDDVLCEIADGGRLDDPLAGRRAPDTAQAGGRGLWLMNQLCDLVEIRPTTQGLTVRLHMGLEPAVEQVA